ncbi:hypothetical protein MIND_00004200 [Mycena indigotica]|uniref:Uncharacterized protein n=1 Tax=Mycena indigotica TaxID=2126181 RepID=A0A8H6WJU3_9AGAR|nr:uncharacterized protein MIND_00004200 [Mycena indigotica]KAF7314904.1 hypothetical protein MIND_00004200 [Mycena indigotica]
MPSSRPGFNLSKEITSLIDALSSSRTTVVHLKQLIVAINAHTTARISRTGNKQDLVNRVTDELESLDEEDDLDAWIKIRPTVVDLQIVSTIQGSIKRKQRVSTPPEPSTSSLPSPSPPRIPTPTPEPVARSPSPEKEKFENNFCFETSPFFKVKKAVSAMLECPNTYGIGDPVEATLDFELDAEEVSKLHSPTSNYQLGLFCTSSTLYSPYSPSHPALPIEFPATCLITVNGRRLTNTYLKRRGFKNAKGSIAPPDLCAAGFLRIGNNSVSIEYTDSMPNHWGIATKDKRDKFYIVVQLIEAQRLMSLVNTLRETRFVPADEIRRQMVASMATNADEDIISSSFKLPLKCPISSARIIVPCRSAKCAHSQCFDAGSWYALMEQTTTWFCPICQKILDWRELIVDGLFAEILQQAPQGVDDVVLEADGSWRPYEGRFTLPSR